MNQGDSSKKARREYRCIACNKVFSSCQGLGGHRRFCKLPHEPDSPKFKCDICQRICKSSQGLGLHESFCMLKSGGLKSLNPGASNVVIQDDDAVEADAISTLDVDVSTTLQLSDAVCRRMGLKKPPGPGGNDDDDNAPASSSTPSMHVF